MEDIAQTVTLKPWPLLEGTVFHSGTYGIKCELLLSKHQGQKAGICDNTPCRELVKSDRNVTCDVMCLI